jgi:hypothetical protein
LFEPGARIAPFTYILLMVGAVGDWISTRIGLAIGLIEGNPVARGFMSTGSWIQVDLAMILVCLVVPLIVTRFIDSKAGKFLHGFPLCAGLMKIGVVVWNLSLIMA